MAKTGTELSRKITITTVTGGPAKWFEKLIALPEGQREIKLMAVYGFANGYKAGASEFGEFVKVNGQFRAVNMDDGVITNSPQMILPNYLGGAMASALDMPGRAGPLKFAFEIDVRFDVTAATKYVYVVRDVMPAQQDDPLSALGATLSYEKPLALTNSAAPAAAPAAETPAATPAPTPAPKGRK